MRAPFSFETTRGGFDMGERKDKMLWVRLTEAELDALKQAAGPRGMSALVRQAIARAISEAQP